MDIQRRTATISARLYGLVLACVVSGALSAIAVITFDFQRSNDRLVADLQARTQALAIDVETELRRLQSGLEVLAMSPSIQNGNLGALHAQGTRVLGLLQLDNIVMRERSGRHVVNINVPFGQPLPPSTNGGLFQSVFDTGLPMVTDLYSSARTGGHLIAIAVPVTPPSGSMTHIVSGSLTPQLLLRVLEQHQLPARWLVALFDSTGTTIARTRAMDRYVGTKAGAPLLEVMLPHAEGVLQGRTRDGAATTTAFRRVGETGWTVTVSIPQEQFTEGLWEAVWTAMGVAAVILLGGFLLAWLIGLRIVKSIRQLSTQAQMLEAGGAVALPPLFFREADELGQAFHAAARALLEADAAVSAVNVELAQVNARLQAFAYALAHDLRQPLISAGGFGSLLDRRLADAGDATGRRYLERLTRAMHQVDAISDALVELARISRAGFRPQLVDASAMLLDILRKLQEREPHRQVQASVQPGMTMYGDPELLYMVLDHLTSNAWKFTAGRTPALISAGSGTAPTGESMWWIRDNGAGFDMAYADKLFQPFQRLHDHSEFPGLGTELANVRAAIGRHGGRVWAEAEPGKGATFYFTLAG